MTWMGTYGSYTLNDDYVVVLNNFVIKRMCIDCKRKKNKQMFVKHLPPARSEYRVPQRPITKTGTKEGQLTQRYY